VSPPDEITRRPSLSERARWWPKGENVDPSFEIHVRLVWRDAARTAPHAVYLTPSRQAGKHGSELHARCEEIGMLVSWCLERGMTLDEMAKHFKPHSPEGGRGLGLFAVEAAIALQRAAEAEGVA
jgi:hypothetical protein